MESKFDVRSPERAEEFVAAVTGDNGEKERVFYQCANSLLRERSKDEPKVTGSADAFHNFAVTSVKTARDYLTAYEIVCKGLELHSKNTDLLADAIKYGYNCAELNACWAYYARLKVIDKKLWTWRAFSFSIDFLCEVDSSDAENGENYEVEIKNLANAYREYLPRKDDSLFSQYEVQAKYDGADEAFKLLEEALNSKEETYPKCLLEYADLMVNKNEYNKALKAVNKILKDKSSGESIRISYVYYLKALCQWSILSGSEDDDDPFFEQEYEERKVLMVYNSIRLSLCSSDVNEQTKSRIRALYLDIKNVANMIPAPYEFEELINQ